MTADSKFVTIQQAADYLNVTKRTVRRAISSGKLPVIRYGYRTARISLIDLTAYWATCRSGVRNGTE